MPSSSMLGKIFYTIPCESPFINDMLDMKLALYTPFAVDMSCGIFLACSDDIETFNLEEQLNISKFFKEKLVDFILIAHKSPVDVAKDHGCYSLGQRFEHSAFKKTEINACKFVRQKPSVDVIHSSGLVCKNLDTSEYVFTDSNFYFTRNVVEKLLVYAKKYYDDFVRFNIELDAYKDFLQPLGTHKMSLHSYLNIPRSNYVVDTHGSLFGDLYQIISNQRAYVITL